MAEPEVQISGSAEGDIDMSGAAEQEVVDHEDADEGAAAGDEEETAEDSQTMTFIE